MNIVFFKIKIFEQNVELKPIFFSWNNIYKVYIIIKKQKSFLEYKINLITRFL